MSSSPISSFGKSTSAVSSVIDIFLMAMIETGRLDFEYGLGVLDPADSSSISSLREISWMAVSSLELASDSSFEFRRRLAST